MAKTPKTPKTVILASFPYLCRKFRAILENYLLKIGFLWDSPISRGYPLF